MNRFTHIVGDYLTFERATQAQHSQSDGDTKVDRLEGLIMAMADFHVQMNFLKMAYQILFEVSWIFVFMYIYLQNMIFGVIILMICYHSITVVPSSMFYGI